MNTLAIYLPQQKNLLRIQQRVPKTGIELSLYKLPLKVGLFRGNDSLPDGSESIVKGYGDKSKDLQDHTKINAVIVVCQSH